MKRILTGLILILLALVTSIHAQFPFKLGSAGQDYGKAAAMDNARENLYVAGLFTGTVDFDPGAGTNNQTSRGAYTAIFLAKYDKEGNHVWAKSMDGAQSMSSAPHAVGCDASDNIFMAGTFQGTVDFDPGAGTQNVSTVGGAGTNWDAFVSKYDKDGNVIWALGLGNSSGTTEERIWDLAVDGSGNVYVTGAFTGSVDFNPRGAAKVVNSIGVDANLFAAKYDGSGNNLWVIPIGAGITNIFNEGYSTVALTPSGGLYFAGNFRGSDVDFDPSAGNALLTSLGNTDFFIACYDSDGNYQWVKQVGGTNKDVLSPGAMRSDGDGNIYLTGHFMGTADFNPDPVNVRNLTNLGALDDIFVASYTSSGALRWAFSIASADGGLNGGHRVDLDSVGNVYVTGWFSGTADFDPGSGAQNLTSNGTGGAADIFLAKYTNAGNLLWAHNYGAVISGSGLLSISAGLTVDAHDNACITGKFYGTNADFDPAAGSEALLSSDGDSEVFVAKYNPQGETWSADPTPTPTPTPLPAGVTLWHVY